MFNQLRPAFAGVPSPSSGGLSPSAGSDLSARLSLMLPGGVRGRVMGRGAAPLPVGGPVVTHSPEPSAPAPSPCPDEPGLGETLAALVETMSAMHAEIAALRGEVAALKNKGSDSERVFEALHAELSDYKRDFVFEHLKPMLRPMLFACDALDEFDLEMALYERAQEGQELPGDALRASTVREGLSFVRAQIVRSLEVCDLEPLPLPEGRFDPHTQKAIATEPVAPEHDGHIQSVRRPGWTLKGHVLRPAEVVVGKGVMG